MRSLTTLKSSLILRAEDFKARGRTALALPLYLTAAEVELELADLFASLDRDTDAQVSSLSAASCLVEARQFQRAVPILQRVRRAFPEAEQMLHDCEARPDQPIAADMPEVRALVRLLLKKGIITEDEWSTALETAGSG